MVLSFILFVPTVLVILTRPFGQPVGTFEHGFRNAVLHGDIRFNFFADTVAWLACLAACIVMGRLAYSMRDKLPFGLTSYVLFLFVVFFGAERFLGYLVLLPQFHWVIPKLQLLQALSSTTVAMTAAVLTPRVRAMIRAVSRARKEHDQFVAAAESSLDDFYILDGVYDSSGQITDFRFAYINANAERRQQTTREKMYGQLLSVQRPFAVSSGIIEHFREVVRTGKPYTTEVFVDDDTIRARWLNTQVVKLGDGIAITSRDVTEERAKKQRIEELSEFAQSMIENAPFSIIATDPFGTIIAMNSAAEKLTFYRKHELINSHSVVLLHDSAEMSARAIQLSRDLDLPIQAGFTSLVARPRQGETEEREWTYIRKDGSRIWVNLAMTVLKSGDKITGYLGIAFDITERKRLTDHVSHLAHYDQLTGLPNRVLLQDRLHQAIHRAERYNQRVAIFMVDIDHFKRINDSLGHSAGDLLLSAVAQKLLAAVRKTDTVSRMGGDEFVIVMPDFRSLADVERCAQQIIEKASTPTTIGNREVNITVSVGLCIYPDCGVEPEHLLKNADAAMYMVKDAGRNGLHMFTESMVEATSDKLELEDDLRHALDRNQLSLHYQPQISCITGEIIGMEALLRWNCPKRGKVPPGVFIPIAEATGLIVPVGEWAFRTACREGREMQKKFGHNLIIAINLSPRQFRQKNLPAVVEAALAESGLSPNCLEIEITEQTLMVNSASTIETLQHLRKLGIKIAIDDFGTGFSSFSYILQYDVDRIKIDRSFVDSVARDPSAAAIVRAIIAMAHGLNMRVVAEGVENIEQLNFLLRRRCDEAQGYYFAKPVPIDEFGNVVRHISELRANGVFGTAPQLPRHALVVP